MKCFEDKFFDFIQSNGLFEEIDRVLLAVSGGADSVAMAYALHRLGKEGRLRCDYVMAHVNHGLRDADSDGDEVFVKELGRRLEMEVITTSVPVNQYAEQNKLSIETAGRTLRLEALAKMMRQNDCDVIATAHHKDDLAETMIHRLMRGTGFRGLCGIWPVSEVYDAEFIRPMLGVRRCEIIQYCTENNLAWREDASNRNINFTRNRIRHRLLPALNNDAVVDQLSTLSLKSQRFLLWTEKRARSILAKGQLDKMKKEFVLEQDLLRNCPPWVFYETIRQVLVELSVGLRKYKKEHFETIRQLIDKKKAKIECPDGVEVVVSKAVVRIQLKTQPDVLPQESVTFQIGQTVQFGPWKVSSKALNRNKVDVEQFLKSKDVFVEWFDADKITGPVEIRQRRDGDRFWPIGGKGEKKIARFLQDAQLEMQTKQQAVIIADAEKILWLAPFRMSEQAKVTKHTPRIVQISIVFG